MGENPELPPEFLQDFGEFMGGTKARLTALEKQAEVLFSKVSESHKTLSENGTAMGRMEEKMDSVCREITSQRIKSAGSGAGGGAVLIGVYEALKWMMTKVW